MRATPHERDPAVLEEPAFVPYFDGVSQTPKFGGQFVRGEPGAVWAVLHVLIKRKCSGRGELQYSTNKKVLFFNLQPLACVFSFSVLKISRASLRVLKVQIRNL